MFKISNKKKFWYFSVWYCKMSRNMGKEKNQNAFGEQDISKLKDKDENGNTEVQNFGTDEALSVLIRMP